MNLPAGTVSKGKVDILIRTIGQFKSLKEIEEVIIKKSKTGSIVYIAANYSERLVCFTHLIKDDAGISKIMIHGVIVDGNDGG